MRTIGVAVAVPDPWASQLQDYRTSIGDETAAMIPTHITLVPPTLVSAEVLPDIERHLTAVADGIDPFRAHLRGTGTFRPVSPVVFVAVVEGIVECGLLADAVRRGPLDVDLAFPYHPHVTVAHDLPGAALDQAFGELAGFDAVFEVGEFHLYLHDAVEGWRPSRDFALRTRAHH